MYPRVTKTIFAREKRSRRSFAVRMASPQAKNIATKSRRLECRQPPAPKTPVNIHHACRPGLCPPAAECLNHDLIQGRNGIAFRVRESIVVDRCNRKCFQDRDLSDGPLSIHAQTISPCAAHLGALITLKFAGHGGIRRVIEYLFYVRPRPYDEMDRLFSGRAAFAKLPFVSFGGSAP